MSCSIFGNTKTETCSVKYLDSIESQKDSTCLENVPNSSNYSKTKEIKGIYDKSNNKIYFINSSLFQLHYDFASQVLNYSEGHVAFDTTEYYRIGDRKYDLFTLVHYLDSDIWTIEFSIGDRIDSSSIESLYNRVVQYTFFGNKLKYFPRSEDKIKNIELLKDKIPIISVEEIYKNQKYQAMNTGITYGKLRKINIEDIGKVDINSHDIIMTNGLPNDMPVVAGIITTEHQHNLSHINVLSVNRGTPNMVQTDAYTLSKFSEFENKYVMLNVSANDFEIKEVTEKEVSNFWLSKQNKKIISLEIDRTTKGLQDMKNLSHKDIKLVGAKAANFAELTKIEINDEKDNSSFVRTPESAFAIPMYYYLEHLKENGIDVLIEEKLKELKDLTDENSKIQKLKEIQDAIQNAPINKEFLEAVENKITSLGNYKKMKFRSSTNAEDLEEFNGAGLYDSYSGELGNEKKSIEKAIKKVWASLWNYRAYEEREYFNIDKKTVAMGILVHRSFPNEELNGVAITTNIADRNYPAFTINAQLGEESVVLPENGSIPEQFLYYFIYFDPYSEPQIEYITYSSLSPNKSIMTDEEKAYLAYVLNSIKKKFYYDVLLTNESFTSFGLDIEFKFDTSDRKLYIKQVRPYKKAK
jgi:phosphoenolpyruvate synthase/pyruvate phosphate dikinase